MQYIDVRELYNHTLYEIVLKREGDEVKCLASSLLKHFNGSNEAKP